MAELLRRETDGYDEIFEHDGTKIRIRISQADRSSFRQRSAQSVYFFLAVLITVIALVLILK